MMVFNTGCKKIRKSLTYSANSIIFYLMLGRNVANTFIPATEIKGYSYRTGN